MTRIRLRYVQWWVDREGRAHHYFRRRGFPRVSLPGLPGSPEFMRFIPDGDGAGGATYWDGEAEQARLGLSRNSRLSR